MHVSGHGGTNGEGGGLRIDFLPPEEGYGVPQGCSLPPPPPPRASTALFKHESPSDRCAKSWVYSSLSTRDCFHFAMQQWQPTAPVMHPTFGASSSPSFFHIPIHNHPLGMLSLRLSPLFTAYHTQNTGSFYHLDILHQNKVHCNSTCTSRYTCTGGIFLCVL